MQGLGSYDVLLAALEERLTMAIDEDERSRWSRARDALVDHGRPSPPCDGTRLDAAALDFFRLTWDLKDLAEYLNVLRSPHQENTDTLRWCQALTETAAIRDAWGAQLA